MTQSSKITMGWGLAGLLAVAFPFVFPNDYYISVATMALILAISTLGLNLLTGYAGLFNLAHGAFMAVGAYTVGILTVDYGLPFWWAFVAGIVVTMVLGCLIGLLSLRLRSHFFAIFTLCVGYIIYLLIDKWDSLTHGAVGIMNVSEPTLGGLVDFQDPRAQYFLVLAFLAVGAWFMHKIVVSLVGRSFIAVRNSDELAQALGINLMRTKLLAFVLSTMYAGLAGGLYAGYIRFLGPDMAYVTHTFDQLMFMLVGGMGTVFGPILGALVLSALTQSLQFLQDYRMLVFGPLLIVLLIFVPDGIVGVWRKVFFRHKQAATPVKKETYA